MWMDIRGLRPAEMATLVLRNIYEDAGFRKYRVRSFEEYSLYAENRSFLTSPNVLTFTDLDGRLMALKPDITLSIAKNTKATRTENEKYYYIESVYRENRESHTFKEISQMGLEYMGRVDEESAAGILLLAARTLASLQASWILKVSDMDYAVGLLDLAPDDSDVRERLLDLIRNKNTGDMAWFLTRLGIEGAAREALLALPALFGKPEETIDRARRIASELALSALSAGSGSSAPSARTALSVGKALAACDRLGKIWKEIDEKMPGAPVRIDFSMINDIEYYNNIIFQGFLDGLSRQVLSGGCYNSLMAKLGKDAEAIGFALYLDDLDYLPVPEENQETGGEPGC